MKKKTILLILPAYSLLAFLMLLPASLHPGSAIPGDGFDGWQNYWNLWWVKQALLNLGSSVFYTPYLYYPTGAYLYFHTLNLFNGLVSLPIQLISRLAFAYNFIVYFSFVVSGFGVYLLAYFSLGKLGFSRRVNALSSFIAGAVFIFCPFHMAHLLGHMQVFSIHFLPFYVLSLFLLAEDWLRRTPWKERWKRFALCAFFFILLGLIDWYFVLYALLFTALFVSWLIIARCPTGFRLKIIAVMLLDLGLMGLFFGLALSPQLWPMLQEASHNSYMKPNFAENIRLSADLLAFVLPNEMHPLWGAWSRGMADNFNSSASERLIFAGYTPLLLALPGLVYGFKRRSYASFFALSVIAFFILALGPFLHINGRIVQAGGRPLAMPYLALYQILPFLNIARSLSRFDAMLMLSLAPLAAMGAAWLLSRRWAITGVAQSLIAFMILSAILFEFTVYPYPSSAIEIPSFIEQLKQESGSFAIAYLPMNWDRPIPLLYQTVHHKYLTTAYTSRDQPTSRAWRTPILQQWRYLDDDIIKADLPEIASTVLQDLAVRYIVLDYYQMPPGSERSGTEHWVKEALPGQNPVFKDERFKVFAAPKVTGFKAYLTLEDGWGERTEAAGKTARQINGKATLAINHPFKAQKLRLEIVNPESAQIIELYQGNKLLDSDRLPKGESSLTSSIIEIDQTDSSAGIISLVSSHPLYITRLELLSSK